MHFIFRHGDHKWDKLGTEFTPITITISVTIIIVASTSDDFILQYIGWSRINGPVGHFESKKMQNISQGSMPTRLRCDGIFIISLL